MPKPATFRYCADPEALMAMKHDGLGWGHDLDCGCFHDQNHNVGPGGIARIIAAFRRKT
ncbi:hypothetical protein QTO30_03535 [Yoonia sp. GPGPB17]|uniref:hypothetical protein n=1 Tax=Yoonia sp. GPGPB17 TaxID=3026147 RepID=UPI0030C54CB0